MKWVIEGFSQEYAMTLKKVVPTKGSKDKLIKIDCTDLVILRWFVDFYPNMRKMTVDGKEYAWLAHNKMLADLPLLDISKRACIERMQKLVEFGILEYKLIKEGGTFSLYTFGDNYINLVRSSDTGECSNDTRGDIQPTQGGMRSTDIGAYGQPDNKDNSIIDSPIIENNSNNILTEFETLWKMYPRKLGKPKALKAYQKAIKGGVTYEQVEEGIKAYCRYIKANKVKTEFIKHGSTWFNGNCWNDEYEEQKPQQEPVRYGGTYV